MRMNYCTNIILLFQLIIIFPLGTVSANKLNILMIIADDLRPALNCYGDEKAITPNINKLAKSSFVFTHSYAQQAVCAPSRNSFLTSRRPDTLRLYDFYNYWRDTVGNFTTLPQYLKTNGYETRSVGKVFHPGITSNFTDDYPLSWSRPTYHSDSEQFEQKAVCIEPNSEIRKRNLICPIDIDFQPLGTLPDIDSMNEAIKILHETRSDPLFLAVGFRKPHIPFRFPRKYLDTYFDIDQFAKPAFNAIPYGLSGAAFNPYLDIRNRDDAKVLNISFPFGPIPREFGIRIRQAYYASVSYVDDLIGQLLKHVDLKTTLVVLTGDHGWSLGEHAMWAKYSNFEVALRVPLIIHSPEHNLFDSRKIRNIVELIDIFPTIVDLIGLPPVSTCNRDRSEITCTEGKSLLSIMNGNPINETVAFSQYPRPGPYPTIIPNSDKPKLNEIKIMGYSIRTDKFRYTKWVQFNSSTFEKDWTKVYGEELYDHTLDDEENMNLEERIELNEIKNNLRMQLEHQFQT